MSITQANERIHRMITVNRLKPLLVLAILTTVVGCRLQVNAPPGGDVTWAGGACSAGTICVIPVNNADFTQTFTATAATGYEFQGWELRARVEGKPLNPIPLQCDDVSDGADNECTVSLGSLPPEASAYILDSLSQAYLTPVYKILFTDTDGDGVFDADDFYPDISLGGRLDTDGDGIPDNCDASCLALEMAADDDDDGDGVPDTADGYPAISLEGRLDTDGDGVPDDCDAACLASGMVADEDDDDDGVSDAADEFPQDASEFEDTDGDGIGDNAEVCPDTPAGTPVDADGCAVLDTDGDGILGGVDQCPNTPEGATVGADGCAVVDTDGRVVVVGQAIPAGAMASTQSYNRVFSIPGQGKVLAQSFTMPGDAGDADGDGVGRNINSYGKFVFHTIPGDAFTPAINIWVSDAPGGEAISPQCTLENGLKASEMRYAAPIEVGIGWWCSLNPNQSYYLNVVHANAQDPSSNIERLVKVTQVLNDDQCPNTPSGTTVDADGCP